MVDLPAHLPEDIYSFDLTAAGTRTAGFAVAAVVAWSIGGVLSDRVHPKPVVLASLAGAAVLALVIATKPGPEIPAGAAFIAMATFFGLAPAAFSPGWLGGHPRHASVPSRASSVPPAGSAGISLRW
jgi:NNP family nitrate/nitrite transporter-like MFS transporter